MRKIFSFLLLACLLSIGNVWGSATKTEGFESATATTTYNSTQTITTAKSDCGIAWSVYYGSPSNTGAINGSKSCLMRYYTADAKLGYAMTTTPIYGLSNVSFKAKVTDTSNKLGVWYSTDGGDTWSELAKDVILSTSAASKSYDIPNSSSSTPYLIKIGISKASTNKKDLIIDDVVFTYSAPTVTVTPTALAFGSVEQNASVASKTFSVTGSDLTGAISIAAPSGYSVDPTSITPTAGAIAATTVTVTPNTTTAGTFNGNVTISGGGLAANATVALTMTVLAPVAVTGVELDESSISLGIGETQTLEATISPSDATNKNVTWESNNDAVATVDANGKVTAISTGSATITVKTANGSYTDNCTVSVDYKSSLIFTEACGGSGTASDDAVWSVTSDGAESNFIAGAGIHYGTGSASVTYLQLSTSDIPGTISQVVVNARDAQATANISVTVGTTSFKCSDKTTVQASNTSTDYTFTGSASGNIVVRIDRGESMTKAIYCKSIIVTTDMKSTLNAKAGAEYGYATFCGSFNFTIAPEEGKVVKAYKASLSGTTLTLHELSGIIPAETGIILAGTPGAEYTINYTAADATTITENILNGINTRTLSTSLLESGYDKVMVFDKTANSFVSHTGSGKYVPAHKAYILNPEGNAAPSIHMEFDEEDNATNIEDVEQSEKVVKFFENGQLYILRDGITYDVVGRIVK